MNTGHGFNLTYTGLWNSQVNIMKVEHWMIEVCNSVIDMMQVFALFFIGLIILSFIANVIVQYQKRRYSYMLAKIRNNSI